MNFEQGVKFVICSAVIFLVVNVALVIFLSLIASIFVKFGTGDYISLAMLCIIISYLATPINTLLLFIFYLVKINRNLKVVFYESISYFILLIPCIILSYYSFKDQSPYLAYFLPYSIIIPALIIYTLVIRRQSRKQ